MSAPSPRSAGEPVELAALRALLAHLRTGQPVPEEYREPMAEALETCLDSRGAVSLDKALGLRRWGGMSIERESRLSGRDEMLVRLWRTCEAFRDQPPISAAKMMHLAAARYECHRWSREKNGSPPPAEPAATWWAILSSGLSIPKAKRLQQILEQAEQRA